MINFMLFTEPPKEDKEILLKFRGGYTSGKYIAENNGVYLYDDLEYVPLNTLIENNIEWEYIDQLQIKAPVMSQSTFLKIKIAHNKEMLKLSKGHVLMEKNLRSHIESDELELKELENGTN